MIDTTLWLLSASLMTYPLQPVPPFPMVKLALNGISDTFVLLNLLSPYQLFLWIGDFRRNDKNLLLAGFYAECERW